MSNIHTHKHLLVLLFILLMGTGTAQTVSVVEQIRVIVPVVPHHGSDNDEPAGSQTTVTQTIELHEGWNWVSTYIDMNTIDGLTKIKEALGDNAQTIQTFDNFAENFGGGVWVGLEDYTMTNQEMIMIDAVNDCQIALEGLAVDPSTVTITIKPQEWTWIGFPVNSTTDLTVALNGFEPEFDDIIQGFAGFVSYFGDADGWIGDFAELEPGQGYMYFSNSTTPKILIFRTGTKDRTKGK